MANYLAPQFKGMHLEEENKMEVTKNDIEEELSKIENVHKGHQEIPLTEVEISDVTEPMSPNTKLRNKMKAKQRRIRTMNIHDNGSEVKK